MSIGKFVAESRLNQPLPILPAFGWTLPSTEPVTFKTVVPFVSANSLAFSWLIRTTIWLISSSLLLGNNALSSVDVRDRSVILRKIVSAIDLPSSGFTTLSAIRSLRSFSGRSLSLSFNDLRIILNVILWLPLVSTPNVTLGSVLLTIELKLSFVFPNAIPSFEYTFKISFVPSSLIPRAYKGLHE